METAELPGTERAHPITIVAEMQKAAAEIVWLSRPARPYSAATAPPSRAPRAGRFPLMPRLSDLKVKLFTDGADKAQILEMAKQPWIAGFTTNPSLLKKAGVKNYAEYGRDLVRAVPDRHISFEVFSDDIPEMVAQGRVIATWGKNVHVKL